MTVETSTRKQTFAGGQANHVFSFRTLASHPEYISVLKTLTSTGVETDLTYNVDYTVSLDSDGVGGTVVVSPTVSTSYTVTVYRVTDDVQESDYDDFNQFPADTLEDDLDRRTLVSQEKEEALDRTAKLPISSSVDSVVLPNPEDGKIIVWSGTGGTLINASVVDLDAATVDTDGTMAANSDGRVPSQKAVKTYAGISSINMILDGGGTVLLTGPTLDIVVPFTCTITEVTVLANTTGSLVIDIWKDTYANYPPTVGDTITASAKPTLSSAFKYQDSTLTGWTTAIPSGSTLRINIDSAATISRALLHLKVRR